MVERYIHRFERSKAIRFSEHAVWAIAHVYPESEEQANVVIVRLRGAGSIPGTIFPEESVFMSW
jgi:hypothetical protein